MITLHTFQGSSTPHQYNSSLSSADSICLDESIEHVGRLAFAVGEFHYPRRNASAEVLHTLCHCVYAHCYINQQNDQPNTERLQWKKTNPLAMKDNTLLF